MMRLAVRTSLYALCSMLYALAVGCAEQPQATTELPQLLSDSLPFVYPVVLWDQNIQGQTDLLLRISDAGAVDSVVIAKPSGYAEFDSAAVQGARIMKFTPGKMGERRVSMWTKLPVTFARDTLKMGLKEK